MSKAICIFCGEEPKHKSKEHIFPQWLLKFTGANKGKVSIGSNWSTGKQIYFDWMSYTLPACQDCNSTFGEIEGKIKIIMHNIADDKDITGADAELLLDWFDKIRLGAWLGIKQHNNKVFSMDPNFHINHRVRTTDRFLSVTNTYRTEKLFNVSGINGLGFMVSPTAFTLFVNNLIFVNCSLDFAVSEKLLVGACYLHSRGPARVHRRCGISGISGISGAL